MLLCVLAFSIQIMVNHKYLGHFLMILYFLFGIFAGQLGLNHTLYYFGSGSGAPYSDMNGYTPYLERLITYKLYWISFSALIIIVSNLFWVRGSYGDFKSRLEIAKNRINKFSIIGISVSLILFIGLAAIYFTIQIF